jgi:threonine 3-dehydrogenase
MGNMVRAGLDVAPVITHRYPVADYRQAFATMHSGQIAKAVLVTDSGESMSLN